MHNLMVGEQVIGHQRSTQHQPKNPLVASVLCHKKLPTGTLIEEIGIESSLQSIFVVAQICS